MTGSRVTAILLNGWILPICGASAREGLLSTGPTPSSLSSIIIVKFYNSDPPLQSSSHIWDWDLNILNVMGRAYKRYIHLPFLIKTIFNTHVSQRPQLTDILHRKIILDRFESAWPSRAKTYSNETFCTKLVQKLDGPTMFSSRTALNTI